MPTGPIVCGVDVGTQGVRAVVLDGAGRELGSGSRPLTGRRDGAHHEQEPREWWDALVGAVREATTRAAGVSVEAVALDATSGTVLVEDVSGAAVGPALMYDDSRAFEQAARVQRVGERTWSSLGYRMQTSWALPKVIWLLDNGAVPAGHRVVHQSDHLVGRLVGTAVATDTSHALKTGADLRAVRWPSEVFGELGVPAGLLPDLVLPGTVLGRVSTQAARATGLTAGAVVRAGMTDGCAAQVAARALRPGSWCSTLGTTLVVKGSTRDLLHDRSGALYSHRHPDGGWLPGGASSAGAAIFRDVLPGRDLDALTRDLPAEPSPVVAYPLTGRGERFPFVRADAHAFSETRGALGDAETFAAYAQGIAYVERLAYDVLRLMGADTDGPVSLTGGATRNDWLNQLRTDVLRRPTLLPASSGAATGMAVLACAEPGRLTETAERMVQVRSRLEPDPERGAAHEAGYGRLVAALAERGWLERGVADAVLTASATGAVTP